MKAKARSFSASIKRVLLAAAIVALLTPWNARPVVAATWIDIVGPVGSGAFGTQVKVLPNGNIVVTDPHYDAGATEDVGAVYLYDGATGELISMLVGNMGGDGVGSGVKVLSNGNYVVYSPDWNSGAGAVTWGDDTTGVDGVVSAANSLVGSTADDEVGHYVLELSNGNYVVLSPHWDLGAAVDAGAVTWGNGTTGVSGVVSAVNSLVGGQYDDQIGSGTVALSNGNYVVYSPSWNNGTSANVGAVTWGDGTVGVSDAVSAANSLVGSNVNDQVGLFVTELSNGNYVVHSPYWNNGTAADAGAATWGNGATGIRGAVSEANSLVGSTTGDQVGSHGAAALSNGSYVVLSPYWDNGATVDAGAATWGNGTTGTAGPVSVANSLAGSKAGDQVGYHGAVTLNNGNYLVLSRYWDNGTAADAGAVTWGNGMTGVRGVVSTVNSLVGSKANDQVGYYGVTALSSGNYVARSPYWDNGAAADAGAATWGSGMTGIHGAVSTANSLVGSNASDRVGDWGVTALNNGNYVVSSPYWDNAVVTDVGAATWGNGTTGTYGAVSEANSLVGSTAGDQVGPVVALTNGHYVAFSPYWTYNGAGGAGAATWGSGTTGIHGAVSEANSLVGKAGDRIGYYGAAALNNGNYVVLSPYWHNGPVMQAGAATWGNGTTGTSGLVSAANSLVGSRQGDWVGSGNVVTALRRGDYVVLSPYWANSAGAVTWGSGMTGVAGPITEENSVLGITTGGGDSIVWTYDYVNEQLVVGRPEDNIVTLLRPDLPVYFLGFVPVVLKNTP